jgi:hypothetical protein
MIAPWVCTAALADMGWPRGAPVLDDGDGGSCSTREVCVCVWGGVRHGRKDRRGGAKGVAHHEATIEAAMTSFPMASTMLRSTGLDRG